MKNKYEISTKDKIEISYRAFILSSLLNLGFSPTTKGTYYLRDLILLALQTNFKDRDIAIKSLTNQLAEQIKIPPNKIKSNMDYAFKYRNDQKAHNHFKDLFGITYDPYFLTAKSIISLMLNLIYMKELDKKKR